MTAALAVKKIPAEQVVVISQSAVDTPEQIGNLAVDEKVGFGNLLHLLLLSSSNDAAAALAENIEKKSGRNFIDLMKRLLRYFLAFAALFYFLKTQLHYPQR